MAAKKSAKKATTKGTGGKVAKTTGAARAKAPAEKARAAKPSAVKAPAKKAAASKTAAPKTAAAKSPSGKTPARTTAPTKGAAKSPAPKTKAAPLASETKRAKGTAPLGVDVGAVAPSFELVDQNGAKVSSKSLAGKPYVLYFYPKDSTPGCTQEACDFRDRHPAFQKAKVPVFGVSGDSEKSHRGFADKYSLPFSLLVDEGNALATAYGAFGPKKLYGREFLGIIRSTFVVGADGKIAKVHRGVKVAGHADAVLAEVSAL